jgi:hypothetical protein
MKLDQNTMLIGLLLGGALLYSRQKPAQAKSVKTNTGSMPGNVGTGTAQQIGGIIGSVLHSFVGPANGNNQDGSPNAKTVMDNINFFKSNPVQDLATPIDYQAAYDSNPELLSNLANFGV